MQSEEINTSNGDSHWSATEIEDLTVILNRSLGPEFIAQRPAPGGGKVPYIEGWQAIKLANDIFGFNGWNSEIKNVQVDYMDDKNGRYDLGLSVTVRVTLKDGTFHEDIGYGHFENSRSKYQAFEKAKKEATTDAMKRALRWFGNALGNCVYNKTYIKEVQKMKNGLKSVPFDKSTMLRRKEYTADTVNPVSNGPNVVNENSNGTSSSTTSTATAASSTDEVRPAQAGKIIHEEGNYNKNGRDLNGRNRVPSNPTTNPTKDLHQKLPKLPINSTHSFRSNDPDEFDAVDSEDILDPEYDLAGLSDTEIY